MENGINTIGDFSTNNYKLRKAFLLYECTPDYNYYPPRRRNLISVHDVVDGVIAAGSMMDRNAMEECVKLFIPQMKSAMSFIPDNVLAYSPIDQVIVWWTPTAVRPMFFSNIHGELKIKNGSAPMPATLFAVVGSKIHVWALKDDRRPGPRTAIYQSPFFNIFSRGTCMGDMKMPEEFGPHVIPQWEKLFFGSAFSNAGETGLKGITKEGLWKSLVGSKKKAFPVQYLIKCGTVEDVIGRLNLHS